MIDVTSGDLQVDLDTVATRQPVIFRNNMDAVKLRPAGAHALTCQVQYIHSLGTG
jgi:hypothetical protein